MSNVLLLLAHSIEEYDQLRLLSEIGHDVFSIGAYVNPSAPTDDKRPALPEVGYHPELAALVEGDQMAHKAHLPDGLIDWAEVIIAHHFVYDWLLGQWGRIRHKRVVWRTVGQSNPALEQIMATLRPEGLQIVRYSPKEANIVNYAGADDVIRFYKDPEEWCGWTGSEPAVGNITQDMAARGDACGLGFWQAATQGLPIRPAGPMSEEIGGIGSLSYEQMHGYLRSIRCYLYTGTQPAPYTLGLIEAMMTGVPVVTLGRDSWATWGWDRDLFEGHEIAGNWSDEPRMARAALGRYLANLEVAQHDSAAVRDKACQLFGKDRIKAQWAKFLGS